MRLELVSVSFFLPSFLFFLFLSFSFFFFFFGGWGGGGAGGSYPESSLGCSLHSVHAPPAATDYRQVHVYVLV